MLRFIILFLYCLFFGVISYGTKTYSHQETSWSDWREGTFDNVIFEDYWRTLSLGHTCKQKIVLEDPSIDQIESLGSNGLLIATDGHNGTKIRRIYIDGSHNVLQEGLSGASFTFAVSPDQSYLYFASRGNPAIYVMKLKDNAVTECVATLDCFSIEKILFSNRGDFYVLSENPAAIFKIDPSARDLKNLDPLYKFPDVPRIKELAFNKNEDTLYAAADNRGLLYALKNKSQQLLLQLKSEEITGLTVVNGEIYFTTISEKNNTQPDSANNSLEEKSGLRVDSAVTFSFNDNPKSLNPNLMGKCYRMQPNGMPECLYSVRDEGIASIVPHFKNGVLLGLSHSGKVIHLKSDRHWRLLADLPSGRYISRIITNADESLTIAASLPGSLYHLNSEFAKSAKFTSKTFDAAQIMRFGNFQPIGHSLEFFNEKTELSIRTGNCEDPDDTWNDWHKVSWGEPIQVEPARFLQYQIEWNDKDFRFNGLKFYYTNLHNLAPTIFHAKVHMSDFEPQMIQDSGNQNATYSFGEILSRDELSNPPPSLLNISFRKLPKKSWASCFWYAEDPNDDKLTYTVTIKSLDVPEQVVTVVKDILHPVCSFETKPFRDGYYQFHITASDELENGQEYFTASYETEPFVIDNGVPEVTIGDIIVQSSKHLTTIKVFAVDQWSPITCASYTVDQGEMHPILPVTGIWDSRLAEFEISLKHLAPGQHTIQVSVEDELGNMGVVAKNFKISTES